MKEKLNKKEPHKLYTLFTLYTSNIVGKTNQFILVFDTQAIIIH